MIPDIFTRERSNDLNIWHQNKWVQRRIRVQLKLLGCDSETCISANGFLPRFDAEKWASFCLGVEYRRVTIFLEPVEIEMGQCCWNGGSKNLIGRTTRRWLLVSISAKKRRWRSACTDLGVFFVWFSCLNMLLVKILASSNAQPLLEDWRPCWYHRKESLLHCMFTCLMEDSIPAIQRNVWWRIHGGYFTTYADGGYYPPAA